MTPRTIYLSLWCILPLLVLWRELDALGALAWTDDRYTHIVLIPFISLGLVYLKRSRIFSFVGYGGRLGVALMVVGAALCSLAKVGSANLGQQGSLTLAAVAVVWTWIAGFIFCYGLRSARAGLFPLACLLLAIPMPPSTVEVAEVALQRGSAELAYMIFTLTSTPVFREGLVFALPGLTIEVARECSGIRSSISLLITALVLSHLFVRSTWRRAWCIALTVPIAIFKNAVRITTLSWLGAYVSPDYIHGNLHRRGGPVFSILSLVLLLLVLWIARRGEGAAAQKQPREGSMGFFWRRDFRESDRKI